MEVCNNQINNNNYFDRLVQERRNFIALAMELHLSCTNPSICESKMKVKKGKYKLTGKIKCVDFH